MSMINSNTTKILFRTIMRRIFNNIWIKTDRVLYKDLSDHWSTLLIQLTSLNIAVSSENYNDKRVSEIMECVKLTIVKINEILIELIPKEDEEIENLDLVWEKHKLVCHRFLAWLGEQYDIAMGMEVREKFITQVCNNLCLPFTQVSLLQGFAQYPFLERHPPIIFKIRKQNYSWKELSIQEMDEINKKPYLWLIDYSNPELQAIADKILAAGLKGANNETMD